MIELHNVLRRKHKHWVESIAKPVAAEARIRSRRGRCDLPAKAKGAALTGHAHRISRAARPLGISDHWFRSLSNCQDYFGQPCSNRIDSQSASNTTISSPLPLLLFQCSVTSAFQRPRSSKMSKSASYSPISPLSVFHSCPLSFSLRFTPDSRCVGRDFIVPAQVGVHSSL